MKSRNAEVLEIVAEGLGELNEEVVYVGGATAEFYVSNPGAPEVRPTLDVDCVIEVASRSAYATLEGRLRSKGFKNDLSEQTIICRWKYKAATVDIMPTDPQLLGFSNRWYVEGIRNAIEVTLPNSKMIRVFALPYFIASKLDALQARGKDLRTSRDFEDIVYLLDNRNEIVSDIAGAPESVRTYVQSFLAQLLKNEGLNEGILSALPPGASKAGVDRIRTIMQEVAD